jgi:hypothetical protein
MRVQRKVGLREVQNHPPDGYRRFSLFREKRALLYNFLP